MAFEDMGTVVNQNQEHELDWDSTITAEGGSRPRVILPEGDYRFLIAGFEKKRYNPKPGSKIPACWNAQLKVLVYEKPEDEEPVAEIPYNLYLHSTQEWALASFFLAIGQKKHGEPLRMNWQAVPGSTGICHVKPRTYNGKEYNDIKYFIDPKDIKKPAPAAPAAATFQAGTF
ncbi:MAG: hypothetical protein MR515_02875 [Acidaminococcus fermentans]|uniref:hypothetical protein n=1 Tax=Acidaminococcus fermentans TaxID=905 RepID=UPI00242E6AB8|nr:hypothetical protein [Acidaminococcus fermentans]MCI7194343.1 hypothetical protein [Acidaminococcus fermentans]